MPTARKRGSFEHVNSNDLWAIVQAGRWFRSLPPELTAQMQQLAQPRLLTAGEWLFRRGDAPCGLYAVARGSLSISGTAALQENTRTALLTLIEPPSWLGEIALFDGEPRTHDACANTACALLHIPIPPLREWLDANPHCWRHMALLLTHKLRASLIALEEQTVLPAPQRVMCRLVQMAMGHEQWADRMRTHRELAVSQEQIARMLGLSRQTTNQILQELQQAGWLQLRRGKLEVLDLAALKAAALTGQIPTSS
ncbi:transcriptional regulator [Comamonas testosteroni]|uniref:Transcriptional regulator n=1 Tax=Comamonas testosteroni TaxID=285 RepID=A0A5A7MDZ1_COMTE|nr:Crp/Fnr family transcriptional regulator [Comamonas thiooxydans]ACY32389.1 transcriptional regulator, Crp/Fnr family [Comamonas thiooxydans]MDO1472716.1 Crp/Fnr family transcriptional regulator [Comamonas thiooxydans]GEQ75923.1 transcriptional regulator [Comamonas testosteroni]